MKTAIIIPSFDGAVRVRHLLNSIDRFDPEAFDSNTFYVFEDPSSKDSTRHYQELLSPLSNVVFQKLDTWSNMHGAARKAVASLDRGKYEWFLYLGDDLLATPFALSSILHFLESNELKSVSLVQIPYWNADDLSPLLKHKDDMYKVEMSWLPRVPRNPHWDCEGIARPYVNVNGAGFACKLSTYDQVGGFAEGTWCLDETISVRTWLGSDQSIVTVPGPPFVHYFGGAILSKNRPPQHSLDKEEAWVAAMGMTKSYADQACRKVMNERGPTVMAEMQAASYFPVNA